jgi:hypothetical protein
MRKPSGGGVAQYNRKLSLAGRESSVGPGHLCSAPIDVLLYLQGQVKKVRFSWQRSRACATGVHLSQPGVSHLIVQRRLFS